MEFGSPSLELGSSFVIDSSLKCIQHWITDMSPSISSIPLSPLIWAIRLVPLPRVRFGHWTRIMTATTTPTFHYIIIIIIMIVIIIIIIIDIMISNNKCSLNSAIGGVNRKGYLASIIGSWLHLIAATILCDQKIRKPQNANHGGLRLADRWQFVALSFLSIYPLIASNRVNEIIDKEDEL